MKPTALRLAVPVLAALTVPSFANAQIRSPGDHPDYHVDIEPHGILALGFYGFEGALGFGAGARFSIPLCKNCFIPKLNNNVAISFGADFAFYPFPDNGGYDPTFLFLPVVMQWNFFLSRKWSVAGEAGLTPWFGLYDYGQYCGGLGCHNWEFWPTLAGVARYHFSEKVALTMRVGFPEFFNIGVSFWL